MPNLVGTGLNQVPTNSMLGGLAYQDPEHASIKDLDLKNLSQINSEIANTAVDVFVYDTSKDSDGGAWRKRTQHTSWYNETLGTATRGTRREFPAVAVLVLSAHKLTIYDGDDPDFPMWMEVYQYVSGGNSGTTTNWHGGSGTFSAVAAINGIIICGTTGTRNLHFVNDRFSLFYSPSSGSYTQLGGISNRNVAYSSWNPSDEYYAQIVNTDVNDVAMTVLPNAPVDTATGLPVPTIAVGTLSGACVVKDDRTVVDYNSFNPAQRVEIDSRYLYASTRASGNDYLFKSPLLSSDGSYAANIIAGSGGWYANSVDNVGETPTLKNMTVTDMTITKDSTVIRSGNDGIEIFDGSVKTIDGNEAIMPFAYITSDYNTGYMVGDIKGAFLSDTYTGADLGPELVTGGNFSNASDWSLGTGWSINGSGQAVHSSGGSGYIQQAGSFTQGNYYLLTADFISGNAGAFGIVNHNTVGTVQPHNGSTAADVYSVAAGDKLYAMWRQSGNNLSSINLYANNVVTVDNVSIKEISRFYFDRSVNDNPLALYGSLTKTPVATGAELVGYSGFSASNYLKQSYNSDFNFGTGSFSIMTWFKLPTSGSGVLLYRGTADGDETFRIYMDTANYGIYFDYGGGSGYSYLANASDRSSIWNAQWNQLVCHATASGEVKIYVNGVSKNVTVAGTPPSTFSSTATNVLHIGTSYGGINPFPGSVALFRVSASVPSAEQIKKMYDDEKVLFQENAKATLYGSSDVVTALAYDDTTNLLHVGTSAGRSEFQGLRRINNTTDAVTTAISASNGLVAEQ